MPRVSVERRKGSFYLYRRARVNGRQTAQYLGPVTADEAALFGPPDGPTAAEVGREEAAVVDQAAAAALAAGAEFELLADRVFRAAMHLGGFRLYGRSVWRRQRGAAPMKRPKAGKTRKVAKWRPADEDDLDDDEGLGDEFSDWAASERKPEPKPAIFTPAVLAPGGPTPEQRRILARAAAGDRAVLPDVRKLLENEACTAGWGNLAGVAELALVRLAAGDNVLVAEAVRRKLGEYARGLLADCGPDPTLAERMAATRATHGWVTVHVLETLAAQQAPGSPAAVVLDRRLSQAERRLHASLKSLATLRRLRGPAVTQVNVATTGDVLVNAPGAEPSPAVLPVGGRRAPK